LHPSRMNQLKSAISINILLICLARMGYSVVRLGLRVHLYDAG
jgi:hypothetical protein